MRLRTWSTGLALIGLFTACGTDGDGTDGTDPNNTDTSAPSDTALDPDHTNSSETSDSQPPADCLANADCDDGDPCTMDTCDGDACTFVETATVACRPFIEVDYPPRGATLLAMSPDQTIVVAGTVRTPNAEITALRLNGAPVEVETDGSFSHPMTPHLGGNTLVFETEDDRGSMRRRVQSFLWGTRYVQPELSAAGMAPHGLALYVDQDGLDDGDPSAPYNDLASLLGLAITGLDLDSLLSPTDPIASELGYDIYLTSLGYGSSSVGLSGIDGGINMVARMGDIAGDLTFDCTTTACQLAGGDGTGSLRLDELRIVADAMLSVHAQDHTLEVELRNVQTRIEGLNLVSNNRWTNALLTVIEPFIRGGIVRELERTLDDQLDGVLAPLLAESLSSLELRTSFDVPSISDPEAPITITVATDFSSTDFHDGVAPPEPSPPQGGVVVMRAGAFSDAEPPYAGLGFPLRNGCEAAPAAIPLTREAAIEVGLHDDLVNELLYAGWRGGLLEFPLPAHLIGDNALLGDLELTLSGMLPPFATDCADGRLLAHIGDVRIDASLVLAGAPVSFTAFSTLVVRVEVTATDGKIAISLSDLESIETELSVNEDSALAAEPTLIGVLESALVEGLVNGLGGDALANIDIPGIDLSASLGLEPGTAVVSVRVDDVTRTAGTTVLRGSL